jgi:hypothetical protein
MSEYTIKRLLTPNTETERDYTYLPRNREFTNKTSMAPFFKYTLMAVFVKNFYPYRPYSFLSMSVISLAALLSISFSGLQVDDALFSCNKYCEGLIVTPWALQLFAT